MCAAGRVIGRGEYNADLSGMADAGSSLARAAYTVELQSLTAGLQDILQRMIVAQFVELDIFLEALQ